MVAYISKDELKGYLRNEQSAAIHPLLDSIIEAASQAINSHCQRSFVAYGGGGATAQSYAPEEWAAGTVLNIRPCTTVTSITEDGTTLSSTYWQAEPVSNLDATGRTVPFTSVRRIDGGTWLQTSGYPGKASISITATWGWVSVPSEVETACRIVSTRIIDEQNTRGGLVDFGDFAAAARRHVSGLGDLLDDLRSVRAWGIA